MGGPTAWNLTQNIADIQDGHAGLILCRAHVQVLLDIIEASKSDGIAILDHISDAVGINGISHTR